MKHTPHLPGTKLRRNPAELVQRANERKHQPEQLYLISESQVKSLTPEGVTGSDEFRKELTQRPIPAGTAFFTRQQLADFIVKNAVDCGWKGPGAHPTLRDRQIWEARLDGIYPSDLRTGASYWTGFTFQDNGLHCTHKYLGDLTAFESKSVHLILDGFFAGKSVEDWVVPFREPAMFGPNKDIPVLLIDSVVEKVLNEGPYGYLRKILDQFRDDDFKPHRFHVSVPSNESQMAFKFRSYILANGDQVIAEWT